VDLKFSIQTKINKPVSEVFDAVINPKKITGYFCHASDAPLVEGQTVHWSWKGPKGDMKLPVIVKQVIKDSKIVIDWPAMSGGQTIAEMTFSTLEDGRTMVQIAEAGWPGTEVGLKASYKNCEGWQHMLSCLKAFTEYGIDLRK